MSNATASQNDTPSLADRLRGQFNVMALIASVFAAFAEVTFFRTNFGQRYFQGWKTGLVILLLIVFPLFWPRHDPSPVLLCLLLYLVMCAKHRANIFRRRCRGETGIHSLYNGISRLERRFPKASEDVLKSRYEPAIMFLMGLSALIVSAPLGWLFIWTSAAMAGHAALLLANQRQRSLDLADARIEGEQLAGMSRGCAPVASSTSSVVRIHRSQP